MERLDGIGIAFATGVDVLALDLADVVQGSAHVVIISFVGTKKKSSLVVAVVGAPFAAPVFLGLVC